MSINQSRPPVSQQALFWNEQVANGAVPFALPTDEPRLSPSFMRETESRTLPPGLWSEVLQLAAHAGADPFSVVLTAVAVVAARQTKRNDLWLGTTTAVGGDDEPSSNLLALRLKLSQGLSAQSLVADVHATTVAASRNRDIPFEDVAALAGLDPLFRVLVVPDGLTTSAWERPTPPDLRSAGPYASACDLVLSVVAAAGTVHLVAAYDAELFRKTTIIQTLEQIRVVLSEMTADAQAVVRLKPESALDFSLLYFASDEGDYAGANGRDKYRLLFEGARFADEHDFSAVWTPERHFHTFGGMFPSPAVAAGALAMVTNRVAIRAGSVVLPLHNPVRVAEEWSLIDNLSNGRVGIAFAAGWQPQDFAIAPEAYRDRHARLFEGIETVQSLWRGDTRDLPGGDGKSVTVRTRPRPVQAVLPTWVTAGGSPETFRRAGEIGANLLTHLLLQSVDQLAQRIAIYRQGRRDGGHAGSGTVTLMLHTFVSNDETNVRAVVHEPFKNYLKDSVGLFASLAPKGLDLATASAEELDVLAEHAFERYFQTSGLFGTPESCVPLVMRLRQIGVTEFACLIDFGVPADVVLASLPWLDELRRRCVDAGRDIGVAASTAEHQDLTTTPGRPGAEAQHPGMNGKEDVRSDDDGVNNSALKSPTELVIAALWQEALGMDEVAATDNFFDSGGHSLLAMQLARGIRERFSIEFALRDLFARPQLRELAAYVDQQMAGATAQMEVVRDEPARGFEYGEI